MKKYKIIIFDLDGTLLTFPNGSFNNSPLSKKVMSNSKLFIKNYFKTDNKEVKKIINYIKYKYGEEISIGLEKEFGIDRSIFFNKVWNIREDNFIKNNPSIRKVLIELRKKYSLYILSDAPQIWIDIALNKLKIADLFKNKIYSGDGNYRKSLGNGFKNFIKETGLSPKKCISVGDQESTDIIPAKLLGMKTILISKNKNSINSEITVNKLEELINVL